MNKEKLVEQINKIKWYRQATDSNIFYLTTPCLGGQQEIGDFGIFPFYGKKWEGYFIKELLTKQASDFLEKAKKDTKFVDDYFTIMKSYASKLDSFFEKLESNHLSEIKLKKLLKDFDDAIYEYWLRNWLGDKFDPEGMERRFSTS